MGTKLEISSNDTLFDKTRLDIEGFSGGCFCCGQQIHVSFDNLEVLPIAKISDSYFQVLICDDCELDINYLEKLGFAKVSFDIISLIQIELKEKLNKLISYYGSYTPEDRFELLANLYQKASKKIDEMLEMEKEKEKEENELKRDDKKDSKA